MKVTVVGTGYVGLVTGTCFAETGVNVVCVDNDLEKIQLLQSGRLSIFEPGLKPMLLNNIEKGRLSFTYDIKKSIENAEVIFIAVGTPPGEDGSADLKHVLSVASDIGKYLNHYAIIATKSTVPVGTAEKVRSIIQSELNQRRSDITFDLASNP